MTRLNEAIRMLSTILSSRIGIITGQEVDVLIDTIIKPLAQDEGGYFYGIDFNVLKERLLTIFNANMEAARILEGRERREPWLTEFKQRDRSAWRFWNDYKKYLLDVKLFPRSVVDELDRLTDMTLDRLFDPTKRDIVLHKKGMVVGHVQSGKTSNYTGLICKAADAGFDFIIVLAGTLNNLRSQTQLRLDEGFLGFDTQYERAYQLNSSSNFGVGKIPSELGHPIAHSYTTSLEKGDFKKRNAESQGFNFNTREPILLEIGRAHV